MYDIEAVNGVSKMSFLFLSIPKLQQRNRWSLVMDFIPSFIMDVISYPVIKNGRLKSPASRLFTQPSIQTQIKKYQSSTSLVSCAGNSPVTGEFPAQ